MGKEKKNEKQGIKEFFADLKKTPQTLEEAKNKTKKFFILVGIIAGVFAVLCALIHILFGLIVALGTAGFFVYLYAKENKKNERNFCSSCGARIDYEAGVAWEVSNSEIKEITPNSNAQGKQIIQKRIDTVHFTCTCTACGDAREFTEKYDAILWYNDGTVKKNNIETLAKNYFKI